jgi:hypothetical protein
VASDLGVEVLKLCRRWHPRLGDTAILAGPRIARDRNGLPVGWVPEGSAGVAGPAMGDAASEDACK